jgi:predicted HicB family RNase H-like nuclease
MIEYKGYIAEPRYDSEDKCFSGTVLNISDIVHFEGCTVEELEQAFQDSVDEYLDYCEAEGREPEKPFSGRFLVRISPDLHRRITAAARKHGKSLNAYVEETLEQRDEVVTAS